MKINSQIEWSLWIKWAIATGIAFLANGVLLSIFSSLSAPVFYFEGFVIASYPSDLGHPAHATQKFSQMDLGQWGWLGIGSAVRKFDFALYCEFDNARIDYWCFSMDVLPSEIVFKSLPVGIG